MVMILIKYNEDSNAGYKGLIFTLRPAVAPTTQVFVQELSRLDSAFAPDNMLIISAILAGFKSENSITFRKKKEKKEEDGGEAKKFVDSGY